VEDGKGLYFRKEKKKQLGSIRGNQIPPQKKNAPGVLVAAGRSDLFNLNAKEN